MPSFFSFSFNSGWFVQFLSYSSLERPLLTINFLHYFSKVMHNSGSYVTRKESLKNAIFKIVRMWNRFNKIFPHPDDFDVLSFSSAYLQLWLFCNFTRLSLFEGNEILSDLTAIFILERRHGHWSLITWRYNPPTHPGQWWSSYFEWWLHESLHP